MDTQKQNAIFPTSTDYLILFHIIAGINFVAFLLSIPVMNAINDWYHLIEKSILTPPDWAFAPAWTILYTLMSVAVWRVWMLRDTYNIRPALIIFGVQLFLNFIWTPIFFGAREYTIALIDITALAVLIAFNIKMFLAIDKTAGRIMIPYLAWIIFATYLNAYITMNN